jgi:hypothetical protein
VPITDIIQHHQVTNYAPADYSRCVISGRGMLALDLWHRSKAANAQLLR